MKRVTQLTTIVLLLILKIIASAQQTQEFQSLDTNNPIVFQGEPRLFITVKVKGNKLLVHAETPVEYYITPCQPEVVQEVDMETEIIPNNFGGIGFQHTGTVGSGATLIKDLKIEWM